VKDEKLFVSGQLRQIKLAFRQQCCFTVWRTMSLLTIFLIWHSRHPPAELKVAIGLSPKNPCGTIYEIISVLNSIFDENMNAHY